jgi:hypothetical protein
MTLFALMPQLELNLPATGGETTGGDWRSAQAAREAHSM